MIPSRAVTEQQRTALEQPALIAEECMMPRYGRQGPLGSVVLTVNSGYQ